MQAIFRPNCTAAPSTFAAGGTGDPVPVPSIDEDEVTMAVAAIEPLLAAAKLSAPQLRRISVSSRTASGFGPILATVLGVPAERVEEGTAILYGATLHPAPGDGPVLHVQSDAPRPGRVPKDGVGTGAVATARLAGPAIPDRTIELPRSARALDPEQVLALARWEREATQRVTMGAYIPRASWERSAGARYRLEGGRCAAGHVGFPPRAACAQCAGPTQNVPLPREGTLETFTVVAKGAGPSEFDPLQDVVGEYAVGVARFGDARVPGIFTDSALATLRVGQRVGVVFRRLYGQDGEWRYGLKLRSR